MERSESRSAVSTFVKRFKELEDVILPAVLLLTGLILIGGDRAGILSLDRIQNLWPVALILVGLTDLLINSPDKRKSDLSGSRSARTGEWRV